MANRPGNPALPAQTLRLSIKIDMVPPVPVPGQNVGPVGLSRAMSNETANTPDNIKGKP
jgi:hypothetical protein